MMKEWSRAMYDRVATINEPPNTQTFDPANRESSIRRPRSSTNTSTSSQNSTSTTGTSDIAHMSNIITALCGSGILSTQGTPRRPLADLNNQQADENASPACLTPTKLSRFLEACHSQYGIKNATHHRPLMELNGYEPDILHLIDDQDLVAIGFNKGNAIRIKKAAAEWWNGPEARKKRTITEVDAPEPPADKEDPKRIAFERRYPDGGGRRFWGPRLMRSRVFTPVPGEEDEEDEGDGGETWYLCEARQEWFPVPAGYLAVEHIDD
jgi:hypothetical protein